MSKLILGDGILGSELQHITGWDYISRKRDGIDFTNIESYVDYLIDYDEIINCIGYTNTYDVNKRNSWSINYKSVVELVDYLVDKDIKLVHFSTDYVYTNSEPLTSENDVPIHGNNWYSYTKLLADAYIELKLDDYLIIRGTHKQKPFKYDDAYVNLIGNFDYIDNMAKIYNDLIESDSTGIYNVGTELKSMFCLAKLSKSDVIPINERDNRSMPKDVSMDLTKLGEFYEK